MTMSQLKKKAMMRRVFLPHVYELVNDFFVSARFD